jgi:SSS family solute:Na+ symporter
MRIADVLVVVSYLLVLVGIGVILRKNAQRGKKEYLLGGNRLPWWMLGISNASGMFDISGTIWMVTIMFVYGVKSVWFPWLWPVFNQVFMFVYMSIWLRRSNASTGAEWMLTRFGKGKDAVLSHHIIVLFALLSCLGFLAYGFIGLGKFIEIFVPFSSVEAYVPFSVSPEFVPHFYGMVFTLFAVFYSIVGGMSSIVWADVVQYLFMAIGAVCIAVFAMTELMGKELHVPSGWQDLRFGWELGIHWDTIMPQVQRKVETDGFDPFGIFFSLMLAKGLLSSFAGPAPNYDMQKILSTRSPREAALMSMFVNVVLLPTRYLMVIGFTVLALLYYPELDLKTGAGEIDFERILPATILKLAPAGLLGLFLVELLSAFMGTFAGTLNAAQAYIVNDIYLRGKSTAPSDREVARVNYLSGLGVVLVSMLLGVYAKDVNSILQWIVGALFAGFIASNVLKWHWWRFNGMGYFMGMLIGILGALILPYLLPEVLPLYYFPVILVLSLLGCVLGSLLSPPTPMEVLKSFYVAVNPWGWWKPVGREVPDHVPNPHFRRDMFNVGVGILAQTSITVLPVFLVLLLPWKAMGAFFLVLLCVVILYFTWYKHLPKD